MKVLIASLDSPGFLVPLLAVAERLRSEGNDVAFACGLESRPVVEAANFLRIERGAIDGDSFRTSLWSQVLEAAIQVKHLEYALERFRPDAILSSHLTLGPLVIRERFRIPVAVLGPMFYLWPAGPDATSSAALASRRRWRLDDMLSHLDGVRAAFGLHVPSPRSDDHALLADRFYVRGVPSLHDDPQSMPSAVRFVGNVGASARTAGPQDALEWARRKHSAGKPVLYADFGRTFNQGSALPPFIEAARACGVSAVVSVGRYDQELPGTSDDILAIAGPPPAQLFEFVTAVACNGHPSALLFAVTNGLPMMIFHNGSGTGDAAEILASRGCALSAPADSLDARLAEQMIRTVASSRPIRDAARALRAEFDGFNGVELVAADVCSLAALASPRA